MSIIIIFSGKEMKPRDKYESEFVLLYCVIVDVDVEEEQNSRIEKS